MPKKNSRVSDPESSKEGAANESGVKRLHYIVHLDVETDQIIKIEEMDEATNVTREMPLPLFLANEEREAGGESPQVEPPQFEFDLPRANLFGQPASPNQPVFAYPQAYFMYPMYWPMSPMPFMAPAPCLPQPINFAAPGGVASPSGEPVPFAMPKVRFSFSTPKVDQPPPTEKASFSFSTPKVDQPSPTENVNFSFSTPKVDQPSPTENVNFSFSTPKVDPPPPPDEISALGAKPKVRNVTGPCLRFRFKSEE